MSGEQPLLQQVREREAQTINSKALMPDTAKQGVLCVDSAFHEPNVAKRTGGTFRPNRT